MRVLLPSFGISVLVLFAGHGVSSSYRAAGEPTELSIHVCATAELATTAPCNGRAVAARVTSRGMELRHSPHAAGFRGDTLALPSELEASVSGDGEVVLDGLDSAEYLYVQVFEAGHPKPLLSATGDHIVVRIATADGVSIYAR